MCNVALLVLEPQTCLPTPLAVFMSHPRRNHMIRWLQRKSAVAPRSCTSAQNVFIECILERRPQRDDRSKRVHQDLNTRQYITCALGSNVGVFCYFLVCRTASPEPSANSSSLTGLSRGCQKREKASSISSDKCTKPRSSLDRTDQSLYTAGTQRQPTGPIHPRTEPGQDQSILLSFRLHITCQTRTKKHKWRKACAASPWDSRPSTGP